MTIRQSTIKALAVLTLFAMIAVACGGGSAESPEESATTEGETQVSGAIPTTAPIDTPATDSESLETGDSDPIAATDGATIDDIPTLQDDPWEVAVLHVNDDVQIIPVFDGPNGNNIKLYDKNEIDNVELEYPLYAETTFGNRLALLVEEYDSTGNWAKVLMPVRPNGSTAWVQTAFFREEKHNYRVTIDVTTNKVDVYQGEDLIEGLGDIDAVSGRDSRPTPVIRAYIDEKIRGETLSPAYGDWVLSIAAFSEALGTFGAGGMPKLALHGTNQPELMGQYVSSGCVRIPNETVSLIADTVPVGTIVDIVAS